MPDTGAVTVLLDEVGCRDKGSLDRLIPLIYDELRGIATRQLRRERSGHTLQPAALVHEVYARMVGADQPEYRDQAHFLSIASQVMRRILIDHARSRNAEKRGGGGETLPLEAAGRALLERPAILMVLDDALTGLERHNSCMGQLIEMRYFGGLTAEESAVALGLEVGRVRRELRVAQAWLKREMEDGGSPTHAHAKP
jgi:RNA polymerase sigma factor (TIGR02999 family)